MKKWTSTPVIWSAHERVRLPTPLTFWAQRISHSTFSFLPIFEASYTRTYMYVFYGQKTTLNLGIRNIRWRNGPSTPVIWSAHERVRLPTPLTFWAQRISHSTFSFLPIFEASYTRTCTGKTTLNLGIRNMKWRNGPSTPVIWSAHERASLHTSSIIWTEWEYLNFLFPAHLWSKLYS